MSARTGSARPEKRDAAEPAGTCPLSQRLRAETRDEHARIERDLERSWQTETLAGYRHMLGRLYGFHASWEPDIARALGDELFLEPRRKLHLLASDLSRLGAVPAEVSGLPRCKPLGLPTPAHALGSLYVMEGSTLGGQLIARRLTQTFGPAIGGALSYHRAYGGAVGPMWRAFRARLDAEPASVHDQAVVSARNTFATLRGWLAGEA